VEEAMKYAALLLTTFALVGCNTRNFQPTTQNQTSAAASASRKPVPHVTGGWEIIATSNQTSSSIHETRIETQFSEDSKGKLTGSPIQMLGINNYDLFFASFQVGGFCSDAVGAGYQVTLDGKIQGGNDHKASRIRLTLTQAPGVQFDFTGTMQADGSLSGTYSGGGTYCPDSGSFLAKPAVSMSGKYYDPRGELTHVGSIVSEDTTISPPTISMAVTATTLLGPLPFPTCTTTFSGTVVGNGGQVSGIPPMPDSTCGSGTEVTYQIIYLQNALWVGTPVGPFLVLYDSSGVLSWRFFRL
jgi:hypothetical protein